MTDILRHVDVFGVYGIFSTADTNLDVTSTQIGFAFSAIDPVMTRSVFAFGKNDGFRRYSITKWYANINHIR